MVVRMFDELAHSVDKFRLTFDRCQEFVEEKGVFIEKLEYLMEGVVDSFTSIYW